MDDNIIFGHKNAEKELLRIHPAKYLDAVIAQVLQIYEKKMSIVDGVMHKDIKDRKYNKFGNFIQSRIRNTIRLHTFLTDSKLYIIQVFRKSKDNEPKKIQKSKERIINLMHEHE